MNYLSMENATHSIDSGYAGKYVIIIVGMHRSGTSMLSGIIDRLGCKGPNNSIPANERNPKGYFESEQVLRLNDEILSAAGTRWNDWQPMRKGWVSSPRFNEFRARAPEVIRAEYGDASMIYVKDPRMCRLLPLWREVFDDMGYRVLCVHTHRHPADVATSLNARKNIEVEPSLGMLSWLCHNLEAEAASRGLPRMFTSYSSLLQDWPSFVRRSEEGFGFTWPTLLPVARGQIAQFVELSLRHHESSVDDFIRDPLVPEPFREALEVLERWARHGEDQDDYVTMDRLRGDFCRSAPLLHGPSSALEAAARQIKHLVPHKAVAQARQAEIETLSAQLAEAEEGRDELSSQKEQLRTELERSRAEVKAAAATAEARQLEIDALSGKLTEAEKRRDDLSLQREELHSELERIRTEAQAARATAQARQSEIDALSGNLAEVEEHRGELSSQREQLRTELERSRADAEAATAAAETRQLEIDALSGKLTEAEKWRDELSSQREQLRTELEQSQAEAEEAKTDADARRLEIEALSNKLAEAEGQRSQLFSQKEQLRAELDQNRSDMEQAQAHAEVLAANLREAAERELKLLEDIATWTNRTIDRDQRISRLQRQADLTRHERAAGQAKLNKLSGEMAEVKRQRDQLSSQKEQLRADLERSRTTIEETRAVSKTRHAKIAELFGKLAEAKLQRETLAERLGDTIASVANQQKWLFQVYSVLEKQPRWWSVMPRSWIISKQHNQLRRMEIFDAKKYRDLYPDVAAGGMDPVRHYILHGMAEGRICPR